MRRPSSLHLLVALTALCLAFAAAPAVAAPSFTEPSFEAVPLATGLDLPTAVAWAPEPDGRMFIAEKEGYVRVVQPDGTLLANPIVDIHDHVIPYGDRGLIGIAVAPVKSSTDVTLYLLYDHGKPEAASEEEGLKTVATATLTSVTVEADNKVVGGKTVAGKENVDPTETPILGSINSPGTAYGSACASESLDCIPADGFTHSIGTVVVDPKDGSLWVGSGDGLSDFEAEAGGVASPMHIRAQNPESLAGKILHVKPNGEGFENSPFCSSKTDKTSNCSKVYALGFRNPFRFTLRQVGEPGKEATVPVIGDVGEGHWEEVDLPTEPGFNGGWPCYEGNEANPDFTSTTQCKSPATPFKAPLFVYTHFNDECSYPSPPNPCGMNNEPGAAVASAGLYTGGNYPGFEGKLFVADYVNGWISAVEPGKPPEYGYSSGRGMPLFATQLGELVDTVQAPDGNLVYVTLSAHYSETALGLGTVQEIRYAPTDKSPVSVPVAASSCINSSAGPHEVNFIGDDSYDPDGDTALSYEWRFGDGSTSTEANPSHTYAADGDYVARLIVKDSKGNSASGFLAVHIHAGQGGQPEAVIKYPEAGREYIAGKTVDLSGESTTPGASWQWQVVRYDGTTILGATPPIETGPEFGSTALETDQSPAPTLDYALHFVMSTGTCTTTASYVLQPQRGQLTLAAQDQAGNPLPVPLSFEGKPAAPAPFTMTVVKNALAKVAAPQTFAVGGGTYEFQRWSDGGALEHEARVFEYPTHAAEETQTLTAIYAKVVPPPGGAGAPGSGTGGSGTSGSGSGAGGSGSGGSGAGSSGSHPPAPTIVLGHVKAHKPTSLQGTVTDPAGVSNVRVAIFQRKGKACVWWWPRGRKLTHRRQSCGRIQWLTASLSVSKGVVRWTVQLKGSLPKGSYQLLVRAVDRGGRESKTFQNDRSGTLRIR